MATTPSGLICRDLYVSPPKSAPRRRRKLENEVGYRITPPVATLNIHPIANAVSKWDANEIIYKLVSKKGVL